MLEFSEYISIKKMRRIAFPKSENEFEKLLEEIEKKKLPVIITSENEKDAVLTPFSSLTPSCRKEIEEEIRKRERKGKGKEDNERL